MKFDILTIFPKIFDSYINESIIKRALEQRKIFINIHNIRDFTTDKHKQVDDKPYGGGEGMIMKIEPIYNTLQSIKKQKNHKIILMSPQGKLWTQYKAKQYSKNFEQLIIICGRYEGIDARIKYFIDEEISIGKYILTGGELGALVLIDSITRLLPGVLGNEQSIVKETFYKTNYKKYPQYTRPEIFIVNNKKYKVPKVLLSGDHKKIQEWREKHSSTK